MQTQLIIKALCRVVFLLCVLVVSACKNEPATVVNNKEVREPCLDHNPQRSAFFGDLHVHTTRSLDAKFLDTRLTPYEAYRFAKGEKIGLPPYDGNGLALRHAQLQRPLDFVSITDHADFFGEEYICETSSEEGYLHTDCKNYRGDGDSALVYFNFWLSQPLEAEEINRMDVCGSDSAYCVEKSISIWQEMQDAAEKNYDRSSSCNFTSFVGYEWTGSPRRGQKVQNLHRNVIFANKFVPKTPDTYFEYPQPEQLWDALQEHCINGVDGCDVLTIPHNSNLSSGLMFEIADEQNDDYLKKRAAFEPLAEIIQHKGASECLPNTSDEQCDFEVLPWDHLAGSIDIDVSPPNPKDYLRNTLKTGLKYQAQSRPNPFKYGFVGSTDTHLGTPGLVQEYDYPGHSGASGLNNEVDATTLQQKLADEVRYNPGGLAVVWAEENSRESLFAAMKRKETYATSGPRMTVRLFGFGQYQDASSLCADTQLASKGYEFGVPMGGDLQQAASWNAGKTSPSFVIAAAKDAGTAQHSGADIAALQMIKVWVDQDGNSREATFTVKESSYASTVTEACIPPSAATSLCATWQDPEFNPEQHAAYYARVLEVPSCRWSELQCRKAKVDCEKPPAGWQACCDDTVPTTIQERAWTSPIWYSPE